MPRSKGATRATLLPTVLVIWCTVLERDEVGPADDFFALGGDSMRAEWMVAEIEDRLGILVSASMLLDAPDAEGFARALASEQQEQIHHLQATGTLPPVVAVHDGGRGEVLWALDLAEQLGSDRPVYAIQSLPIDELEAVPSFEALAARYVRELQRVGAPTPECFFGNSLGAMISLEMAIQLEAVGTRVDRLVVGDLPVLQLDRLGMRVDDMSAYSRPTLYRLAVRIGMKPGRFRQWLGLRRLEPTDRAGARLRMRYRDEYTRLLSGYVPSGRFSGSVLLLRGREHADLGTMGWEPHVAGAITVVDVPRSHVELLDRPQGAAEAGQWTRDWLSGLPLRDPTPAPS